MPDGVTKRIVVIKDVPSNVIEEAILILKSDSGLKGNSYSKERVLRKAHYDNAFLYREANMIISDYLKGNGLGIAAEQRADKITKLTKNKPLVNRLINLLLMGSIALLVFLIARMI